MTKPRRKRRDEGLPLFAAAVARRVPPAGAGRNVDWGEAAPIDLSRPVAAADTRRAAGLAIGREAESIRERVLEFIREGGQLGCTDEEVQFGLALRPDTARARRCELRDAGLVFESGRTRATTSGRQAIVWLTAENEATAAHKAPSSADATVA